MMPRGNGEASAGTPGGDGNTERTPRVSETERLLIVTNNRQRVFQRNIIRGAEEVGLEHGYLVEVLEVPRPADATDLLERVPGEKLGVMLIADVLPDEAVASLQGNGVPLTLVSHQVPDLEVPSIMHDNRQGLELLAREVFERCGREKPLYIGGSPRQRDSAEREKAFRRQLMQRGIPLDDARFLHGEFEPRQAADALAGYLERGGEFDSIVAADYLMAIACLEVLTSRGVTVPAEVAVAGFGDGPEAESAGLTTVAADVVELGRRGARQLVGQRQGLQIRGLTLLSTMLIRRRTTG